MDRRAGPLPRRGHGVGGRVPGLLPGRHAGLDRCPRPTGHGRGGPAARDHRYRAGHHRTQAGRGATGRRPGRHEAAPGGEHAARTRRRLERAARRDHGRRHRDHRRRHGHRATAGRRFRHAQAGRQPRLRAARPEVVRHRPRGRMLLRHRDAAARAGGDRGRDDQPRARRQAEPGLVACRRHPGRPVHAPVQPVRRSRRHAVDALPRAAPPRRPGPERHGPAGPTGRRLDRAGPGR